jgi:fibronectin-binding autotransporter adhesin
MAQLPGKDALKPLSLAIAGCLVSSGLQAATLTVTNALDAGDGSLRWAIDQANTNGDPENEIVFDPAVDGQTIVLGDVLTVSKHLTITGNGMATTVISGNNATRIFDITDQTDRFELSHATLTGALGTAVTGGAITSSAPELHLEHVQISDNETPYQGAGIRHTPFQEGSELYIRNSIISNNTVTGTGAFNRGGGIHAELWRDNDQVNINNSQITGNHAYRGGGLSIWVPTTAFDPGQSTVIIGSTISGNSATDSGGGILAHAYSPHLMRLTRSTVSDNQAGTIGGGVAVYGSTVDVQYSLVARNSAATRGGGLFIEFEGAGAPYSFQESITLFNATFSSNELTDSDDAQGAGVFIQSTPSAETPVEFSARHVTVAFNSSNNASAVSEGLGITNTTPWPMLLDHSITTNNTQLAANRDLNGDFEAAWSLLGARGPGTSVVEGDGVQNVLDGGLLPLQNNGGLSHTHALSPNGPAFMAGNPDFDEPVTRDQRFTFPRIANDHIDIGAFESQRHPDIVFSSGFGVVPEE